MVSILVGFGNLTAAQPWEAERTWRQATDWVSSLPTFCALKPLRACKICCPSSRRQMPLTGDSSTRSNPESTNTVATRLEAWRVRPTLPSGSPVVRDEGFHAKRRGSVPAQPRDC